MCGIVGMMRFDNQSIQPEVFASMLDAIAHRGRDASGCEYISPQLVLGHRRLSIIDLKNESAQPMSYGVLTADKPRFWITYNGEIYNYLPLKKELLSYGYTFQTASDTEVLLAAYQHWGKHCVHHLNGMFAFALWDAAADRLFCARDPLGIKPFYYLASGKFFAFASESRALATLTQYAINVSALHQYILTMYVPTHESIFADIQKLLPAHTLTITQEGHIEIERYWQLNTFATTADVEEHKNLLHQQLKSAVKRQLQSDVPVGGFLSGGIDSGIVTAMAAEYSTNFHTYSIAYEGLPDSENELPYARSIAERYHTKHTEVFLSAADAMCTLTKSLQHLSEPIADPAIVGTYLLAEYAARDGVKVLLNGTGGDEIFAGYTRYTGMSRQRRLAMRIPAWSLQLLHALPLSFKTKMRLKNLALDMLLSTGGSFHLLAKLLPKQMLKDHLKALTAGLHIPDYGAQPVLYQRMLVDLHTYLPHELLLLLDQMTMAHTLEGRVPLLDVDVVSAAFQLPAHEHIKQQQTKSILKQIAANYLTPQHIQRKKQGFAGSTYAWVKQHFSQFIETIANVNALPGCESFNIDEYCNEDLLTPARANDIFILYGLNVWYDANVKRA